MKHLQLKSLIFGVLAVTALASCHKDKITPHPDTPDNVTTGIYVLNQGGFNSNNSSLTYYDFSSKQLIPDQFQAVNGRGLGDTGNDVKIYGSKMYIIVNVSSTVEIVDPKTAKSIKQIKMVNGKVARQPRYIAFYKGKAYISSYDNTVAVMDTATLEISKYIKVGRNPEQLVVANDKLYVANSGGLDFGNPDKTVSVIDLASETEIKQITVGLNPVSIAADSYGDVYVISFGDYALIKPSMTIINTTTDEVKTQTDFNAGYGTPMAISGDLAYLITADNKIEVYNVKTESIVSAGFITDGTAITQPYGLKADPITGELYVTDAKDYTSSGAVYVFNKTGKLEYSIATGVIPGTIALLNK